MSMRAHLLMAAGLLAASWMAVAPARAQEVTKDNLDGITNFHRIQSVVACTGAIKPEVVPQIRQMGFVSIINLREPTEEGANIEGEGQAAKAVGLRYYSVPFNAMNPDPAAADKFLDAITAKGVERAFIHRADGGRAAPMWIIKRMAVAHSDVDRAANEATDMGRNTPRPNECAIESPM